MIVEESIHVVFDESNDSLEKRENIDDDVGLDLSIGRLQIEDGDHQEEEESNSKKEGESPMAFLHLLNLSKENLVKNY